MKQQIFALGFFDGVHLGHQALLAQCVALAKVHHARPAAITFENHPMAAFTTEYPPLLSSLPDRVALLRRFGMEEILPLAVTKEMMATPWRDFLEHLLARGAAGFVCGHDFRFGHKGEGNAETLKAFCAERGLPCIIVQEQLLEGRRISSTHIRSLIEAGQMEEGVRFLGHAHLLSGQVISGRKIGSTIGVPTANLLIPEGVVVPKFGVYAARAWVEGTPYPAVTNIGTRPTVGGHRITVESWLQGFDGDLYGQALTLELHQFLRPEQKFDSLEELRAQIQRDADSIRSFW